MKRNEIALILVVVGVVVLATYALFNSLFGQAALSPVKVKQTTQISSTVENPDSAVFNKDAINPAVNVTIGNQSNQQPFTIQN